MARPNLTQDEVDSFRHHAATTALAMVEEEGVEALTLRALAARLGCSYAKPYRYFRDKAHLLDAVRGRAFDLLREQLGGELADFDARSSRPAAELYVRFALEHREVYRGGRFTGTSLGRVDVVVAQCEGCGFVFNKRNKLSKPSRCPSCKSERIEPPRFTID